MRKPMNAKEHIKEFNEIKNSFNMPFTKQELIKKLREKKITANKHFLDSLKKEGILIRIHKTNTFKFQEEPVHYKALQKAYFNYRNNATGNNKPELPYDFETCVLFLKAKGCLILVPDGGVYQQL